MNRKKCFVVGAGDFNSDYFNPNEQDYVIAADEGYHKLIKCNRKVDEVVGDFDSLGYVPAHPNVTKHPVMKDDTDMALAVKRGMDIGYREFYLFGGTGNRPDHTLANMQLLSYLAEQNTCGYLIGDNFVATAMKEEKLVFTQGKKETVSVFAVNGIAKGVYLTNLKYPLNNAAISPNCALGVSNEFVGKRAEIEVNCGILWVIWYFTKRPFYPIRFPIPKGVIFDFDGTILDSMFIWKDVANRYLVQNGRQPNPLIRDQIKSLSFTQVAEMFQSEYGIAKSKDEIISGIYELVYEFYRKEAVLKPGARLLLQSFYQKKIPMILATANDRFLIEETLKRLDIIQYFDDVLTCHECSTTKESAQIYKIAAEKMGIDIQNVVVFEDALYAVLSAKNAGFYVAAVKDDTFIDDKEIIEEAADCYLVTLNEWTNNVPESK